MHANQPAKPVARGTLVQLNGAPRPAPVDLIVLSVDHALLAVMQAVCDGELLFSPAASAEIVVEHLIAGRCGILLVDLVHLRGDVTALMSRLAAQFPGLVLMVAGRREDQAAVAPLITQGVIYRYVHKPLSPGRAQQFLQAALRRHRELNEREPFGLATVRELVRVQVWQRLFKHSVRIVGGAAGLVAAALIASALRNALHEAAPASIPKAHPASQASVPPVSSVASEIKQPVISQGPPTHSNVDAYLGEAQRLIEMGRLNDATRVLRQASSMAPADTRVAIVATTIGQQLLTRATVAIGERNFELAARRIDAARVLDREFNLGLPDLQATEHALAQAQTAQAKAEIDALLETVRVRREAGELLAPTGASAFDELQRARTLAPDDSDVRSATQALAFALLNAAARALDEQRLDAAAVLLEHANQLVPDMSAARDLQRRLEAQSAGERSLD